MLTRVRQIGRKVQAVAGAEETLAAADYSGEFKDLNRQLTIAGFTRENVRPALTQRDQIKGSRSGQVHYTQELVGGAAGTNAPWHRDMRGLGFAQAGLVVFQCGSLTNGPFRVGEIVGNNATRSSATVFARVAQVITGSPNRIVLAPITGSFANGNTVHAYRSPQTSVTLSSTSSAAGYWFRPISETSSQISDPLTVEMREGGLRHTITDARARGGLTLRRDEPLQLRSEYTGIPIFDTDGVSPRAGSFVADVPEASTAPPPVVKSIPFRMFQTATAYTPIVTALEINFDNTLAQRQTIADNDVALSGHLDTRITGRTITATLDPEMVLPADGFDFIEALVSGQTFDLFCQVGSPSAVNGLIVVSAPRCGLQGDFSPGDREGKVTQPLTIAMYGDVDDEIAIFHVFA